MGNIIRITILKMKEKVDTSGEIPPKVIKGFLIEGPFIEDEIAAEYFGGVLASSKLENSRDDREFGLNYSSVTRRLYAFKGRWGREEELKGKY
jgi:hypothetical protein